MSTTTASAERDLVPKLTSALEDYLETIYELVRDRKVARVKDIATARQVRPASVSPAMKRLAEMGLINYNHREYIDLTPEGERAGRRIYARHQVLTRFFHDILRMSPDAAQTDACAMEHSLSAEGMDHLVRFIEFIELCSSGQPMLEKFHGCPLVNPSGDGAASCASPTKKCIERRQRSQQTLAALAAGEEATVSQVNGAGPIRQRLLDMGILPNVRLTVERIAPGGSPIWIKAQGFQLSLRKSEAEAVVISLE